MRIFLSADLVGSTEFKTTVGKDRLDSTPHPRWVQEIKQFYVQFPSIYSDKYSAQRPALKLLDEELCPQLWKTIGDEIIFCGRVLNLQHFTGCLMAFLQALEEYGRLLESSAHYLDIKGTAWIACFPYPNTTVPVASGQDAGKLDDLYGEDVEAQADKNPRQFDFLGRDIDVGFRVSKHAAASRLALSGEAAFLLCEAANEKLFMEKFVYSGRDAMKGVMRGKPYPIISIDTERSRKQREIIELERRLTNKIGAEPSTLGEFIRRLFEEEKIELPVLPQRGANPDKTQYPDGYRDFVQLWENATTEVENREKVEESAANANGSDEDRSIAQTIEDQIAKLVAASSKSGSESPSDQQSVTTD